MEKKRGTRKQRFKKRRGKLGQGVGALKRWGWLELALELYKQLTHKLPVIHVRQNPFMAESYCNFLWLLVKYESLQDSVSLALLKTVKKTSVEACQSYQVPGLCLLKMIILHRWFWDFLIRLMVPVLKKPSHLWSIAPLTSCNLKIFVLPSTIISPLNYEFSLLCLPLTIQLLLQLGRGE